MILAGSDLRRLATFAGIIASYSLYGLLLEKIVRDVHISTISMLFTSSLLNTIAAYVFGQISNMPPRVLDQPQEYVKISASVRSAAARRWPVVPVLRCPHRWRTGAILRPSAATLGVRGVWSARRPWRGPGESCRAMRLTRGPRHAPSPRQYLGAMWASTHALHNVSYVTQVLAKSGKALPIMIVGFFRGRKQKLGQWVAVLYVIFGVVSFTLLSKMKSSQASTLAGMLLILMSLCLDGVTGTLEDWMVERAPESRKPTPLDFMFNINFWSVPLAGIVMLANGEFYELFDLVFAGSASTVFFWGLSGAMGQCFIFYVIAHDGAVVCSIATTLRKFTTVLLSILYFQHPVSLQQMMAIGVVFSGVAGLLHQKRNPDIVPRQATLFIAILCGAALVMLGPLFLSSANWSASALGKGAF